MNWYPPSLVAAYLFAFGLTAPACSADTRQIFVAPGGNDNWTGALAAPDAAQKDGPLATLEKARDVARALRKQDAARPICIYLRGGQYLLAKPLELTGQDSGTATAPLVWSAYQLEKPVVSAGVAISNWKPESINGREAWAAHLAADHPFVRELWVNGQRRPRARFPKRGYLAVAGLAAEDQGRDTYEGTRAILLKPSDLSNWPGAELGEAILFTKWTESHLPIASVNSSTGMLAFSLPTIFKPEQGDPLVIENVPECMTEPGEWCLDHHGMIRYLPLPGETPATVRAVVPALKSAVQITGGEKPEQYVQYVEFDGIAFSHTEWLFDPAHEKLSDEKEAGFSQAEVGVGAAIEVRHASHCAISRCSIEHIGTYGISLGEGCTDVRIDHCRIEDIGAGGIKIGTTRVIKDPPRQTSGNIVSDCVVADGGRLFPSAIGVWIGESSGNALLHNDIHGFWYSAISIGWTWGYGESAAGANRVEDNLIHHIGTPADGVAPTLSDMGGIYTLGAQAGTVIRHNQFHDIAGRVYGGWGIYFDEGTQGVVAENNLVYRTTHGGFHQHYGSGNTVRNNIFAFGRDAQIQRTRIEDHPSFTFQHNIVCWDQGTLLTGDWTKVNVNFDENVYWPFFTHPFDFGGRSIEQWRQQGQDVHSVIAAPRFVDAKGGNFNLPDDVPLNGFVRFPLDGFGPR